MLLFFFKGCSEDIMYLFSFLSLLDTLFLYMRSCVVSFLSLYTCFLFICMQSIISVSHKDALMSFV